MNLKKLRNKVIAAFAVMMFALVSTVGVTYAYWASTVTTDPSVQEESVTIGEADAATATISVVLTQDTGTLVPSGQIANSVSSSNPVESIVLSYVVDWDSTTGNPKGTTGILKASVSNISGDTNGLLNFAASTDQTIIVDGDSVTVTITVTMDEPADQAEYNAIKNAIITFDVTFTVDPNAV